VVNIARTCIGSSKPVDVCEGYFLFGAGIRAGTADTGTLSKALIKKKKKIGAFRFGVDLTAGVQMGLCGPAYGVAMDVFGDTDGNDLTLRTDNHALTAGIVMGLALTADASVSLQVYKIKWKKGKLRTKWRGKLSIDVGVSIDLLRLIFQLINYMFAQDEAANGNMESDDGPDFGSVGAYSILDTSQSGFALAGGEMVVRPKFTRTIDFSNYVPALQGIKRGLSKLGGDFTIGLVFGLAAPTRVRVPRVRLFDNDDNAFSYPVTTDGNRLTGTTSDGSPTTVEEVEVTFEHRTGFDFTVGATAGFSVLKIFSFGATLEFGVLDAAGLVPTLDPKRNTARNTVGSRTIASAPPMERVKIVFHPPTTA